MENAENLIKKIVGDSNTLQNSILSDAKLKADEYVKAAKKSAEKLTDKAAVDAEAEFLNALSRNKTVAELDSKKLILHAKKQLLKDCFDKAKEKIVSQKDMDYVKFVSSLVAKYGENGDSMIISRNDEKRLTNDIVAKIGSVNKLKITLSKERGDFMGGVLLFNAGAYKNLTVEMLINEKYAELELRVLKELKI